MHQIGEVARLAKVSIRLLRHYDDLGLLTPSGRSEAGYRLYSHADLQRLQQILFYRSLEFPLDEITGLMNEDGFDRRTALLQQRELLSKRAQDLNNLLALINKTIAETENEDNKMSTQAMFEVFPDMTKDHLIEAEQNWGDTDAWKQSKQRSKKYDKDDWLRMKQEMDQVNKQLEAAFKNNPNPSSKEALAAVEAARLMIDRWHYECSKEFHVNLTAMTSEDERFVNTIDQNCPGLAVFIHEASKANLAVE